MKSLAFLIFIFLVVPGSGQLAWDGLPFSTRLEFATLVVFVVAFSSGKVRDQLRLVNSRTSCFKLIAPSLLLLSFLKLLTFSAYPLSDGYESCYRSLYYPIEDENVCEKSYEAPILPKPRPGSQKVTRVDRVIDFGVNPYDWSLPFVNEYPRLGNLWLTRLPFTATYRTTVANGTSDVLYLPVLSNGKVQVSLGDKALENENYLNSTLSVLPMPPGSAEFLLKYEYRDDELSIPPDEAPEPRGSYAILKVGEPQTAEIIQNFSVIRIEGWSFNSESGRRADFISLISGTDNEIARVGGNQVVDNGYRFDSDAAMLNGFSVTVSAKSLRDGPLNLIASYDNQSVVLAKIRLSQNSQFDFSIDTENSATSSAVQSEVDAWLDVPRESLIAYAPSARSQPTFLQSAVFILIDLFSALLVIGLLITFVLSVRRTAIASILLALAGWIAVNPLDNLLPQVLGGGREHVIPYALVSLLVLCVHRNMKPGSFAVMLPLAVVLAYDKVFDHLTFNHDDQGQNWWGKLLFLWRDSDWFTSQGFARQIFVSGSLQGGDDVFWFQAGPRYWALFTRVLLGENDVLVGLIMTTLGFLSVIFLSTQFLDKSQEVLMEIVSFGVLLMGLIFQGDQLITAFGFVGSSEHPTWIVLFAITGYLLRSQNETRMWLLIFMSSLLGFIVHLRPNQIFLITSLFVLIMLRVNRRDSIASALRYGWMVITFGIVGSLSLLHNLYYGGAFVPFTTNASINVAFEWTKLWSEGDAQSSSDSLWGQIRSMMYWRGSPDPNFAISFWGSQLLWLSVVCMRLRRGVLKHISSLLLMLPFTYILPMLKFQLTSYYPRHLVAASLACLCAALLAWPTTKSQVGSELPLSDRVI